MRNRAPASVTFVLVTLGLDALGVGIIAPIVPQLVQQLGHLSPDRAAPWVGTLLATYAAVQFFAAPVLGGLSDRFGRRPVILASVFGLGCDYIVLAFAPNLWWLFAGRVVAGATSANVAAATAYIADVSPDGDRPRLFGLVGATFGAGFVIGPALGGLAGSLDLRLPFMIAAGLSLANFCFGIFVLPESLDGNSRRAFDWTRANPIRQVLLARHDRELGRLALAWSCTWVGLGAVQSTLVLFTTFRFHWGAGLNGLALAGVGLSQALVEGLLLRHATAWLGERRTAILGYSAGMLGYATLALAISSWMILSAVMLLALGGLATPSVRSLVAGKGEADTQGEMQGMLASVESLTAIVAPLLAAGLFFTFTSKVFPIRFPGAPFMLAATFAAFGVMLMRRSAATGSRSSTPSPTGAP